MDVGPYDHLRVPGADEGARDDAWDAADGDDAGDAPTGDVGDAADGNAATAGTDLAPGVYRVVGVGEREATLLRVTDADGRRVRSGHVEHVAAATVAALDPAEDPDAGAGPVRALASLAQGLFWSVRGTLRRLGP